MLMKHVRTYKALLILSSVFFIGMTLFGLVPSLMIDGSIWERSIFLKGISIIFGFSFVISMISYIYVAVTSMKPYQSLSNYFKIASSLMILALYKYVLPDDIALNETIKITLFLAFGFIIIICNCIYYIKSKKSIENKTSLVNYQFTVNTETITNEKDGIFLFNLIFWAILAVSFSNNELNSITGYIVILFINALIIFKYLKTTLNTYDDSKNIIILAIILYIGTLSLLATMPEIIVTNFGILFALLPSIFLFHKILKNYYTIIWRQNYE